MGAKLVVTAGPNRGAEHALGDRMIFNVGSDRASTIPLDDPKVRPNHCRIYREDDRLTLFDVTGEGLLVNGSKVAKTVLHAGDVIAIGDSELQLQAGGARARGRGRAAAPPAPAAAAVPADDLLRPLPVSGRFYLQCVEGNDEGKKFELAGGSAWILGRGLGSDVVVMDIKVSRAHCRIDHVEGIFYVNDLGSMNGSFVNGRRVEREVLRRGDHVKIGYTVLAFQYETPAEVAAAPLARAPESRPPDRTVVTAPPGARPSSAARTVAFGAFPADAAEVAEGPDGGAAASAAHPRPALAPAPPARPTREEEGPRAPEGGDAFSDITVGDLDLDLDLDLTALDSDGASNALARADAGAAPSPPTAAAPPPIAAPAGTLALDLVHFSAFAPSPVARGSWFVLEIWAFLERERDAVRKLATSAGRNAEGRGGRTSGAGRGASLSVAVEVPGFIIEQPGATLPWSGGIAGARFEVAVPPGLREGSHHGRARVLAGAIPIGSLRFEVVVGRSTGRGGAGAEPRELPGIEQRVRSVFASYAAEDRDLVLEWKRDAALAGIDVFVDALARREAPDWERELWRQVPAKDLFCLFWSETASRSEWVEREWRCALQTRGPDYIHPVPLVDPRVVPPPSDLASLRHFEDLCRVVLDARR